MPRNAWHCAACEERISTRESTFTHVFQDIDQFRSKVLEDELIEDIVNAKLAGHAVSSRHSCEYCGLNKYDLCSPLVVGLSRAEHEAYLESRKPPTVNGIIEGSRGTAVRFSVRGRHINAPTLTIPYLPPIQSQSGQQLKAVMTPIVHEICALNMFKARMDKEKHAFRRCRNKAAEKVIWLSGITLQPLGFDDAGHEYWKFPSCDDLFVCKTRSGGMFNEQLKVALTESKIEMDPQSKTQKSLIWKRITDVATIRKVIDILGRSSNESHLKQALVYYFLVDIVKKDIPCILAEQQEPNATVEGSVKGEVDRNDERNTAKLMDRTPSELSLVIAPKAIAVEQNVLIEEEEAFDAELDDDSDDDDGEDYKQYFRYNRRSIYYAIAVKDGEGRGLHLPKGSTTITYQVHREGVSQPLMVTPLDSPWSDGIYYFSTITFKRSGNYTLSFIAEGAHASALKPLVFPVTVTAKKINFGISSALQGLLAKQFMNERDREISWNKRLYVELIDDVRSELDAVKSALLSIYYALPRGCLHTNETENTIDFISIAEASGWSDLLDQIWQGRVAGASRASTLMECMLLLEHYIRKQWIDGDQARVVAALPNAHFAMRCCSISALSLRIYTMDRVLIYSHVEATKSKRSRSSGVSYDKGGIHHEDSDGEEYGVHRSKRQRKPVQRLHETVDFGSEDEDSEDRGRRISRSSRVVALQPTVKEAWCCSVCGCENSSRARSCEACGERKPTQALLAKHSSMAERAGSRERKQVSYAEDVDSEEVEEVIIGSEYINLWD